MRLINLILAVVLIAAWPLTSFSSNFNWKFSVESINGKTVGDDEREEKVEDWICTIGKPQQDKFGNELRRFGCKTPGDLQTYLYTKCTKDKNGKVRAESGTINLQMKKKSAKMVSLYCE